MIRKPLSGPRDLPPNHDSLIHDVSRLRRTVFDSQMKPMGITRAQWWVLMNLSRNETYAPTQTELAQLMDLGKGAVGRLIDRLVECGWVERTRDPVDRRALRIAVTQQGRELIRKMASVALAINESCMAGVTSEQQQTMVTVLAAMKRNLCAMDKKEWRR